MFRFANPTRFRNLTRWLIPVSFAVALLLLIPGLYYALYASPPDYQQHDSVRIMYIHVPSAWIAMMAYASIGAAAVTHLIWKHLLAGLYIRAVAPVGAIFTIICLVSGSLWGLPTWGTWWVWDARLTSVLILFFLYIGIIILDRAYENPDRGMVAAAWLAVMGLVNLPVIKFSVDWWNTLHQQASLTSFSKLADPSIHPDMLRPLLLMAGALTALFIGLALTRLNIAIADRRKATHERL
jgi:heme exporter protein C